MNDGWFCAAPTDDNLRIVNELKSLLPMRVPWWYSRWLWVVLKTKTPPLEMETEPFDDEVGSGGFTVDWVKTVPDKSIPIVMVFPGLGGSSDSTYCRSVAAAATEERWRVVIMNYRGNSKPLQSERVWSAEDTRDLHKLVTSVHKEYPEAPLFAIGFSCGGNLLVKLMGEMAERKYTFKIDAAVSCCNAFEYEENMRNIEASFVGRHVISRVCAGYYHRYLRRSEQQLRSIEGFDFDKAIQSHTVMALDKHMVGLYGFDDVDAYYNSCQSYEDLAKLESPLLVLQSADDPMFMNRPREIVPLTKICESQYAIYMEVPRGSHISFIEATAFRRKKGSFVDRTMTTFFKSCKNFYDE